MSIKNLQLWDQISSQKFTNLQLKHSNSYHIYATTRYNFVRLKATHKISPLEVLVGGRIPP
jgi:hypothetical protein